MLLIRQRQTMMTNMTILHHRGSIVFIKIYGHLAGISPITELEIDAIASSARRHKPGSKITSGFDEILYKFTELEKRKEALEVYQP